MENPVLLDKNRFKHVELDTHKSEAVVRPSITYTQDAWRRLKNNKVAITCLFFLIFIVLMCIFVPVFSSHSYTEQLLTRANEGPSLDHLFGLDDLGRDIFTRLWMGGRVSLMIGFAGTLISLLVGAVYGGISGYFGGRIDDIMMRIVEILVGIPYLIVVIIVSIVLNNKGMSSLIIALCITSWTDLARIVRGQVLSLKESEYVLAAKTLGVGPIKIILKHLLPNTLSVIIVNTTFSIPGFIFAEAFLSFLGMGIQPPNTSWGAMAALGQQQMSYYPHELIFPALAISLTMLAFNLLGDGLRDAFDPKLRQ
jgi:oligopeptide transport system permease protein